MIQHVCQVTECREPLKFKGLLCTTCYVHLSECLEYKQIQLQNLYQLRVYNQLSDAYNDKISEIERKIKMYGEYMYRDDMLRTPSPAT